jgi:two-component system, chemotaxis family, CheB/CheR fusion protein
LLGRDQTIRRYTAWAGFAFKFTAADFGRSIHSIRTSFEIADLEQAVAEVMESLRETEREVQDEAGRWYSLRVRPYRSVENAIDGAVLVLVDIDTLKRNAVEISTAREYAEGILRTLRRSTRALASG